MPESSRRRRTVQVRTSVMAGLVFMCALALAGAGLTAFYLERIRLDADIDATLERDLTEFTELANNGVDPSTGEPFADVQVLLRTGLQRTSRAPNEGILAYVDGRPSNLAPPSVDLRLEDDPELLAELDTVIAQISRDSAQAGANSVPQGRKTQIETSITTYRLLALPVKVAGDDRLGTLVLAFDHTAEHRQLAETFQLYALVSAASLLLISAVAWIAVGRMLRPIRLLREAAENVSSSDLSRRLVISGSDDMAALGETFNGMMERLEHSFASQRQLLDDAGHELRTPLTIVRGHLELMDTEDPLDAATTKDVVLDELDRMNRLVDDLMTLARSRRPDFVAPRLTDIAMLTDDVLGKAQHLGNRKWSLDALADVTANVDPQRLTQALLQLCANAVRFSTEGSVIAIGSRTEPGWLYLWVRDEGRGIDAADFDRIFGRFERLNTDIDGSGLGLPIVRSIAVAHGGRVDVQSELGVGTTMTLAIPLYGSPNVLEPKEAHA